MGYMNEFPHTRQFDSDLREIIQLYLTVKDLPNVWETYKTLMDNNFNELKLFVDQYFDNLDVQKEVNDKIDKMIEDGSFLNLISTFYPLITPQMFGAKADGIHDDTDAINAAINSITCGTIYFPVGIYNITSGIVVRKGINLIGAYAYMNFQKEVAQNNGSVIRAVGNIPAIIIQYPAVSIENLMIEGQVGGDYPAIQFNLPPDLEELAVRTNICNTLKNVYIRYFKVGITATSETAVFKSVFENVWCNNCTVGFAFIPSGGGTSLTLINCWATWCTTGFKLFNYAYSSLINCCADNCRCAYDISHCGNTSLINCGIESSLTPYTNGVVPIAVVNCSNCDFNFFASNANGIYDGSNLVGYFFECNNCNIHNVTISNKPVEQEYALRFNNDENNIYNIVGGKFRIVATDYTTGKLSITYL